MRFIHTSDWHLGRTLHNQSLLDEQAQMLETLLTLIETHQVDALVIAGDIFDRSVPPAAAVSLLDDFLDKVIQRLKVSVIAIGGNHDGQERLAFGARQMAGAGLYIQGPVSASIDPVRIDGKQGAAFFYPIPYAEPALVRHLLDDEDIHSHQDAMAALLAKVTAHKSDGLPKIVISHCFLDGGSESDSERPLSIGGADKISPALFTPFDYAALGHLHGPQYKGAEHVRYSGSPLKYSFSEQHQNKSVTLVDMLPGQAPDIRLLPIKPQRDVRIIEGYLDALLAQGASDPGRDDYLMVRLLDTHAILEPMAKLRAIYPNVLHLERTGLMQERALEGPGRERMQKSELTMFEDFFTQVQGESLSGPQKALMSELIASLHREGGQ
ncbi:exonuclease SbcCD subunit D [Shewanella sp. FJAT-52076]|uniref:exonuclease SbcCD subunit D n=1 Tax=Shewanella sp. FJAT-52076 TaxID=2864202 RepID=UPI001C65EFEC|nr:exonuclease SbcCD subunit D [Shewanella sp. FJAT-52076]QYJ76610.1 exonuclease SbcCD subunit D [Shewanella sp. FJAT-52076]